MMRGLDPTEKPPDTLRTVHKVYQQASIDALTKDTHILDLGRVQTNEGDPRLFEVKVLKRSSLAQTFACFEGLSWTSESSDTLEVGDIKVYEYRDLPGK